MNTGLVAYCPTCGVGYRFYRDRDTAQPRGVGGYIAFELNEDGDPVDEGKPFDWACLACGEGFAPSSAPHTRQEYERWREIKRAGRRLQALLGGDVGR